MRRATLVALLLAGAASGAILGWGLGHSNVCGVAVHQDVGGPQISTPFCRFEPQAGMFFVAAWPILFTGLAVYRWRWAVLVAAMLAGTMVLRFAAPEARLAFSIVFGALLMVALGHLRRWVAVQLDARLSAPREVSS